MRQRTPADWVPELFTGFLTEDVIRRAVEDFTAQREIPLVQLGIDSMAVMGLVLNLESVFGLQIDYASFDIRTLATMGSIEDYLVAADVLADGGSAA
ncbi:phosphopantetheine-binding protein [Streptomyces sp. NPDC088923]|uniref:phosphopantetheine-binding protein n=1 Tax=Streptomyces sp. NPDC088923 TaxID=3365913 RepID=UPI0037FE7103